MTSTLTITGRRLASAAIAGSATALYTAQGGTNADGSVSTIQTWIDAAVLNNTSGAPASVSLWLTTGSAPDVNTRIMYQRTIPAGGQYVVREMIGQWIPDGGSIYGQADVAGVAVLIASGREFNTSVPATS